MPFDLGVAGGSLQLVREVLAESSHPLLDVDEVDLDMGDQNIMQCKRKICDGHYTTSQVSSITQVVNLFLDGKCLKMLVEYTASAPLTSQVKPSGGIRLIVVDTIWRRLVSNVNAMMISHSLDGY
ncbi:hypothetical protein Tco_0023490 [Tanacetum coccineum]